MAHAIGGIQMVVPLNMTLTHQWYPENKDKLISSGTYSFDGKMLTEIVHERYSLKNGEYGRQQLQEESLKGIDKKTLSPSNITNSRPL